MTRIPAYDGPQALYWVNGRGEVGGRVYHLDPDHSNFEQNVRDMGPLERAVLLAYLKAATAEITRIGNISNT